VTAPRTINIGYTDFSLAFGENGLLDTSHLSVCEWCTAVVTDEKKHTEMHSCGCSAMFRVELGDHFHEVGKCPLAEDCGGWTWDPPCGGCDRCLHAQATHTSDKGLKP
jgi:hypothetical protein